MRIIEDVVGALYKDVEAVCILAHTAGPVPGRISPPILYQAFQVAPLFVVFLDQRAPSVPRIKTSMYPGARDVEAGSEVRFPPRDVDAVQVVPVQYLW